MNIHTSEFKTVCVIGLGYIGLPTAALLANNGYNVIGVDINENIVNIINNGMIHIVEPDLDSYVKEAVKNGNLKVFLEPKNADVFIICVPTPFHSNYKPNIDFVIEATNSIIPYVKDGNLIILESTSPIGTTEKIRTILNEKSSVKNLFFAHCPERVLPGKILKELVENDRIVGGTEKKSTRKAVKFYKTFVNGQILETDSKTAEMAKLSENTFRDINIAFANEISMICDKLNINVWEVIKLANHHPRVNILEPGPGVGGHCIAVDPWFIYDSSPNEALLIKKAREVNESKPIWVINKIKKSIKELISKRGAKSEKEISIACYGLTYKANSDDIRESPAHTIVKEVIKLNICKVLVIEPNLSSVEFLATDTISFLDLNKTNNIIADIHLLLVDHKEFKHVKPSNGIIIDTRGIWIN